VLSHEQNLTQQKTYVRFLVNRCYHMSKIRPNKKQVDFPLHHINWNPDQHPTQMWNIHFVLNDLKKVTFQISQITKLQICRFGTNMSLSDLVISKLTFVFFFINNKQWINVNHLRVNQPIYKTHTFNLFLTTHPHQHLTNHYFKNRQEMPTSRSLLEQHKWVYGCQDL